MSTTQPTTAVAFQSSSLSRFPLLFPLLPAVTALLLRRALCHVSQVATALSYFSFLVFNFFPLSADQSPCSKNCRVNCSRISILVPDYSGDPECAKFVLQKRKATLANPGLSRPRSTRKSRSLSLLRKPTQETFVQQTSGTSWRDDRRRSLGAIIARHNRERRQRYKDNNCERASMRADYAPMRREGVLITLAISPVDK